MQDAPLTLSFRLTMNVHMETTVWDTLYKTGHPAFLFAGCGTPNLDTSIPQSHL